jgi:hypothetical protein
MRRFSFVIAAAFMAALASHAGATNLIVNGDFQSGNTGFTSDYFVQHAEPWTGTG